MSNPKMVGGDSKKGDKRKTEVGSKSDHKKDKNKKELEQDKSIGKRRKGKKKNKIKV
jgi:hypothetical protein